MQTVKESLGIVKTYQLGGDIEAYCGKCKEMREHAIAALDDKTGVVKRVTCRTCQGNHLYRAAKAAPRATGTRTPRMSKKEAALLAEAGPARAYSMQSKFAVGDRIEHPKFGTGLVTEVRSGKIDVKFGREQKTLVHGGM